MAELTQDQLTFLASHGISVSSLFDASGMTRAEYQRAMKQNGKRLAFGVSRCKRGHHSIRTRAGGHCVQCNPAGIAFDRREDERAYVYIAASQRARMIKVGLTGDLHDRRRNLNVERWAGHSDWQMLAFANCPEAGRVERAVHDSLTVWADSCEYRQAGTRHRSCEVFRCNFGDARDAVLSKLPAGICLKIFDEANACANFNFRER